MRCWVRMIRVGLMDDFEWRGRTRRGPAPRKEKPIKEFKWRGVDRDETGLRSVVTYAVEAIGTERVKIGQTRHLEQRLKLIQSCCPVPIALVALCERNIETELHQQLRQHRVHGEWFKKTKEVVEAIAVLMPAPLPDIKIR